MLAELVETVPDGGHDFAVFRHLQIVPFNPHLGSTKKQGVTADLRT